MDEKLINGMRKILNKHDPIGIYYGKKVNYDEYDPEISEILKVYKNCKNARVFTYKVHNIFKHMFSPEIAGNQKRYAQLSKELWNLLND